MIVIAAMASRIDSVRRLLYDKLLAFNVRGTWGHVLTQRGMFSYTGIRAEDAVTLKNDHHVYMLTTGRISLAGLNEHNVERFVKALVIVLGTN